jgi:hypothetical protein
LPLIAGRLSIDGNKSINRNNGALYPSVLYIKQFAFIINGDEYDVN